MPEHWQRKVLTHIGDRLSANARLSKFSPIQIAVASGNAIGKTALPSWLIIWSLVTFEDCLGVVTAGTEPQIRSGKEVEARRRKAEMPKHFSTTSFHFLRSDRVNER